MVIWLYGYMVIWLYGYMVIWLYGYNYGYMVIWLYGYMDFRSDLISFQSARQSVELLSVLASAIYLLNPFYFIFQPPFCMQCEVLALAFLYAYFQSSLLSQIHNKDFNEQTQGHARGVMMLWW